MEGIEATKQIRALGSDFVELPIIAMTANALSGDREKSLAAGMNGHVTKPINPDEVFKELSNWVRLSEKPKQDVEQGLSENSNIDVITELPGIDLTAGLNRMRGNWSAYKRILKSFHKKHKSAVDIIEDLIRQDHLAEAALLAHSLKGSGGNLGADALFKQAASMEKACREGNQEEAMGCISALRQQLQIVMTGLETLEQKETHESDNSSTAKEIDRKALLVRLEQIEGYLEADLSKAQVSVESLKDIGVSVVLTNSYSELQEALNSFDIEAAGEAIQRLKRELLCEVA